MNRRRQDAIKANVAKMILQEAPQEHIDMYLQREGVTKEQLSQTPTDWKRIGYQVLGGMGGAAAAGPPNPVTTPLGIGLGSGMAGQAYDIAQEKMGKKNPEPLSQRMKTGAEDVMMDTITPAAISKVGTVLKGAGAKMLGRGRFKSASLNDFAKIGVDPSAAVATQSKPLGYLESALGDYAFSGSIVQKHAEKNVWQMKQAITKISKQYGNILSPEELGVILKKSSKASIEKREAVFEKLFSSLSKEMGDAPREIINTRAFLMDLAQESKLGPDSDIIKTGQKLLEKGKGPDGFSRLTFEALKSWRSRIGELIKSPILRANTNAKQGDLKRLYGALTKDMDEAALEMGPKINAKWKAVNKYYNISVNNKTPMLEQMANNKFVEEIQDIALKNMQKGGTRLRLLRSQIPQKEWGDIAGTVLGRMGKGIPSAQDPTGSVFSATTFITNWNKIAPEAKKALFYGTKYKGLAKELDSFVRVASDIKSIDKLANNSKTGSVLSWYSIFGNMGGMATGVVTGTATGSTVAGLGAGVGTMIIAPREAAKLITNPKFVKWLTTGAKIVETSPNSMKAHLGRLFALREEENIKDGIDKIINHITGEGKVIQ